MRKFILACALCVAAVAQPFDDFQTPGAVPLPTAKVQMLDVKGKPLSFGKVFTYAAGTDTPLATYTDALGNVANANPVVLDAGGFASIWIKGQAYKIVVQDALGVQQWTADSVTDTTFYYIDHLKYVSDSALLGYKVSIDGEVPGTAVQRSVQARLSDTINVTDFGAKGDGTTDDAVALGQALAETSLTRCVYFPDGVYATSVSLSVTHPVCLVGQTYRIKYTGTTTVAAVFSIIGDPAANRSVWIEGSRIEGAVFDGNGRATNGLLIQGVVAGDMTRIRATNVTDAGVWCHWCQQINFNHLMVSGNYEPFTTTPQRGVVLDVNSTANIFNQISIERVSGTGIEIVYGGGNQFYGGTSEGNRLGASCTGSVTPYATCWNNTWFNIDMEANTDGDYLFGIDAAFNQVFGGNSFSNPGAHFLGGARQNIITGGFMGPMLAEAGSVGNRAMHTGAIILDGTPQWTDHGDNQFTEGYNQGSGVYTQNYDYHHTKSTFRNSGSSAASLQLDTSLGSTNVNVIGDAAGWIRLNADAGLDPSLRYSVGGVNFYSESAPGSGIIPDGTIRNHLWGFGRYNLAPVYPFHFFDAGSTTIGIQAGSGQGGFALTKWMNNAGTQLSAIAVDGTFNGPVEATSLKSSSGNIRGSNTTGAGGSWSYTFSPSRSATPFCVVTNITDNSVLWISTATAAGFTVSGSANKWFNYICIE